MGSKLKRINFWVKRKVHLPLLIVAGVIVTLLFLNEDTSMSLNMKYDKEIQELKSQIQECRDSAMYYKHKREALLTESDELEHVAREQYNMQRPTEDVFLIKEKNKD